MKWKTATVLMCCLLLTGTAEALNDWVERDSHWGSITALAYSGDRTVVKFWGLGDINYTYCFDLRSKSWKNCSPLTSPSPRASHVMAYIGGDQVLLFGGICEDSLNTETWVFDLSESTWTQKSPVSSPSGREGHAMAYIGGDQVLLFGGRDSIGRSDETWVYDLSESAWMQKSPVSSPSGREDHAMAYIGGDQVLLFGGDDGDFDDETWVYDLSGNIWTQKSPVSSPSGQEDHAMAYMGDDRVLLFGGWDGWGYNSWAYVYDLSDDEWIHDENDFYYSPDGRVNHSLCETSMDGTSYLVLYGGFDGSYMNDTWTFGGGDYPLGSPQVSVIFPNGGEILSDTVAISWSAADPNPGDSSTITILLSYSINGGDSWVGFALDDSNDGLYYWDSGGRDSDSCLIWIEATDTVGCDASDTSDTIFTLYNPDPPEITVIRPYGGEMSDHTMLITWTAIDPDKGDSTLLLIDLEYSDDTGSSWSIIDSNQTNDGLYQWSTVALPDGDEYLVRLTATDTTGLSAVDTSDAVWTIYHPDCPQVTLTYPNGGEALSDSATIAWTATDADSGETETLWITFEHSSDSGDTWASVPGSPLTEGFESCVYGWIPPGWYFDVQGGNYDWQVVDLLGGGHSGNSAVGRSCWYGLGRPLRTPRVHCEFGRGDTLTFWCYGGGFYPGDSVSVYSLSPYMILDEFSPYSFWQQRIISLDDLDGSDPYLNIDPFNCRGFLALDDFSFTQTMGTTNDGSHVWDTSQFPDGSECLLRVKAQDSYLNLGFSDQDESDSVFSIENPHPPEVTLTHPNGGEFLTDSVTITWTATDLDAGETELLTLDLECSDDAGSSWSVIDSNQTNDGAYLWDLREWAGGCDNYLVRATATDTTGRFDEDVSDSIFSVNSGNRIVSITDIPDDDGRQVALLWERNGLDTPGCQGIDCYTIWRKFPLGGTYWEHIDTVAAAFYEGYAYTAPTLYDSTALGLAYFSFIVSAHTADPHLFADSAPDSGYSLGSGDGGGPLGGAPPRDIDPSSEARRITRTKNAKSIHSPAIVSVVDVPRDQGRQVAVLWDRSDLDDAQDKGITCYSIWRAYRLGVKGLPDGREWDGRSPDDLAPGMYRCIEVQAGPGEGKATYWEYIGQVDFHHFDGYAYIAPTLEDSSAGGTPHFSFYVSAHTDSFYVFYDSAPDSGYSVDNVAPDGPYISGYPAGGAKGPVSAIWLAWTQVTAGEDGTSEPFPVRYRVYCDTTPDMAPSPGGELITTYGLSYQHTDPRIGDPGVNLFYVVTAVDIGDNESAASNRVGEFDRNLNSAK